MNILLVYATNSGSTEAAANVVKDALTAKSHLVTMKTAHETSVDDVSNSQVVIIGSPSWDYEDKEGQPHEDILSLMKQFVAQ